MKARTKFKDEDSFEDFWESCELTAELLDDFEELELSTGPALAGALTQIICRIIAITPTENEALQLLTRCFNDASLHVTKIKGTLTHYGDDSVH
jgi:hypothetical protein|tara:strand:- start:520 stop:801 length:282 start_codon:yes stop_codon:yes gene_type:complete